MIAECVLRHFYQRYGFRIIKDFHTDADYKNHRKHFHVKSNTQTNVIQGYQCNKTIPRCYIALYDRRMETGYDMYQHLKVPIDDPEFFPDKLISSGINQFLESKKTLMHNSRVKEVDDILTRIDICNVESEVDQFLIKREYLKLFLDLYQEWSGDNSDTTISQDRNQNKLPRFEKLLFQQFRFYYDSDMNHACYVCKNCRETYRVGVGFAEDAIFVLIHLMRLHVGVRQFKKNNDFDLHLKGLNRNVTAPCYIIAKS